MRPDLQEARKKARRAKEAHAQLASCSLGGEKSGSFLPSSYLHQVRSNASKNGMKSSKHSNPQSQTVDVDTPQEFFLQQPEDEALTFDEGGESQQSTPRHSERSQHSTPRRSEHSQQSNPRHAEPSGTNLAMQPKDPTISWHVQGSRVRETRVDQGLDEA